MDQRVRYNNCGDWGPQLALPFNLYLADVVSTYQLAQLVILCTHAFPNTENQQRPVLHPNISILIPQAASTKMAYQLTLYQRKWLMIIASQ